MSALDVIVMVSDLTPKAWINKCLRTVHDAAEHSGFDVTVIETKAIEGHIGEAMREALMYSDAGYVAWVDDDDWVLPNAFSCLAPHLTGTASMICARELRHYRNGNLVAHGRRHHLTVYHRRVIRAAFDLLAGERAHPNVLLRNIGEATGEVVDVMSWVYVHRVYASRGRALRGLYPRTES